MPKLFGTDGIRARAGEFPLDDETVVKIGSAFAAVFADKLGRAPRFVSGRDTRESGEHIETLFHAGAFGMGATGESAGVITTPGVAYTTRHFEFDVGVVISASHNPFADNGIKIFLPSGQKCDEKAENAIENYVENTLEIVDRRSEKIDLGREGEFRESYLDHFAERFASLDLSGIKIVADCANGASSDLAPQLFGRFGANLLVINDNPDGRNINKDCGSLHLEGLKAKLLEQNADFGVAFDGDADRSLFIDERGEIVDGDATLWILGNDLKTRGELRSNKVVATVMSNIGLETAFREKGIELLRAPVGDKFVLEELLKSGSELGGEQSGHIIMPQESLVGDGMMTALSVLNVLANSKKRLSELVEGFQTFPQILVNVHVREKRKFEDVPEIATASRRLEEKLGGDGRLLLRYSGTENLARVMVEGKEQKEIEGYANDLADVIKSALG
ncbi:MAG: phosphoglucosamine mutase [Pyrinomonadaceae bacterium]